MRPAQERGEGVKKAGRATYLWLSPFLRFLQVDAPTLALFNPRISHDSGPNPLGDACPCT